MTVTAVYAAVFGLVFVALSFRVIRIRQRLGVGLGDGEDPLLRRAIRVHGNFAEYVPFALLLVYFAEQAARKRPGGPCAVRPAVAGAAIPCLGRGPGPGGAAVSGFRAVGDRAGDLRGGIVDTV